MTSDKQIARTLTVQGGAKAIQTLMQHLTRLRVCMNRLPSNAAAHQVRVWAACYLSIRSEQIRDEKRSPIAPLIQAIDLVSSTMNACRQITHPLR